MTVYVAGFAFDDEHVLLIEKKRPTWQSGYFNAIGGHVEPGEELYEAMKREFYEETGLTRYNWTKFCQLSGEDWCVHFYFAKFNTQDLSCYRTCTDEGVIKLRINDVLRRCIKTLPNVPWLLSMALSMLDGETAESFLVEEKSR